VNTDRRNDVIRAVSAGVGAPLALAVSGWPGGTVLPASVALVGAIVGLLVGFFVEHALDWRAEARSQGQRVSELEREVEHQKKLHKILEYRTRVAQAEAGISQIGTEVFGGAFNEAQRTGHFLPVEALMARIEVEQKAKGLDKPVPPPEGI
jgi:hypothetical protein